MLILNRFNKINMYIGPIVYHILTCVIFFLINNTIENITQNIIITLIFLMFNFMILLRGKQGQDYYYIWLIGNFMQILCNMSTVLIYSSILTKSNNVSNIAKKNTELFVIFSCLFKSNFVFMMCAYFILIFSLLEMEIYKETKNFKSDSIFLRKYYFILFCLFFYKFCLIIFSTYHINNVNNKINETQIRELDLYKIAFDLLDYCVYNSISSFFSAILAFFIFVLTTNYSKIKFERKLQENSNLKSTMESFSELQSFCFFLINWKNCTNSFMFMLFLYVLFLFFICFYKDNESLGLPIFNIKFK